jgi:hypothetical protein
MKTQLIPLESHDDLISVRDRMSWAKTPRILLIWPLREDISLRPLDLKVLQRQARSLGAQLGLVTRRWRVHREAQALGIPVFKSTGEAQRTPWPEPAPVLGRPGRPLRMDLRKYRERVRGPERSWQDLLWVRISSFLLGVFAVLTLLSLFIPRAQITLSPETESQGVTMPVYASPSVDGVYITGRIPARQVTVRLSGQEEVLATGNMPVPETEARGVVTFRNLTDDTVLIPAGTVVATVSTDVSVQFVTLEDVELPSGAGETVNVPVKGVDAGATGNVQAGALRIVKGDLGLRVAVTNDEPLTGGLNRVVETASPADRENLRENLLKRMEREALADLRAQLGKGDQLFADTLVAEQVLDESFDPPVDQPGRKLSLRLQVDFSAYYAAGDDLTELAGLVLNASLDPGFTPAEEEYDFEQVGSRLTGEDGVTRWVVRVKRRLVKQVDGLYAARLALGRRPRVAAQRIFESLPLSARPEIVLNPEWWPWLPLLPFNITVD